MRKIVIFVCLALICIPFIAHAVKGVDPAVQLLLRGGLRVSETHRDLECKLKIEAGECDQILSATPQTGILVSDQELAGQTICIQSGTYRGMSFTNIEGVENNPVTISNCGGQVVLDSTGWSTGIQFMESKYFHLTGTGSRDHLYGFRQSGAATHGVNIVNGSTNYEVDYISVADNAGGVGIAAKSYPFTGNNACRPQWSRPNFVQRDTHIHHNLVKNSGAEGMYIGTSHYHRDPSLNTCNLEEPSLEGVLIHDNIVDFSGNDGIQVGAAISGVEVFGNTITNFAVDNNGFHKGGLQINPGTVGKFYNNSLQAYPGSSEATGVELAGGDSGDVYIYNNLFEKVPKIMLTLARMYDSNYTIHLLNNTFIGDGAGGLYYFFCPVDAEQNYIIKNNIFTNFDIIGSHVWEDYYSIVNGGSTKCIFNGSTSYNANTNNQLKLQFSDNLYSKVPESIGFKNYSGKNYQLNGHSAAVNSGVSFSSIFEEDLLGKKRTLPFDMGAYEYLP